MKTNSMLRVISAIMIGVFHIAFISGCGENTASTTQTGESLTYWVGMHPDAANVVTNYGEAEWAKALQEKTNISVTFIHPPVGQGVEKFNLLVASKDMPDIIEYEWRSYPCGPDKAVSDGIILTLNPYQDKAVNLFGYLDSNPGIKKLIQTDEGAVYAFPFIRSDRSLLTSAGLIIRQDWLDDLGLPMPQTIDDWEKTLIEFRDKKGAESPLTVSVEAFRYGAFVGAFGVTNNYYIENDTVKYGPAEPGFKEFLEKMQDWYSKGLIDSNLPTMDTQTIDSNILNGQSGATYGSVGRGIGRWMAGKTSDSFKLEGAPYPVLNTGDKKKFGQYDLSIPPAGSAAITTDSKKVDAALKLLDYGYSQEGSMLYNFGIEGKSFEIVNGNPVYTDYILNNPDGLSVTTAMSKYLRAWNCGPFIQDKRYMEQYAALPEQKRAWKTWEDTDAALHVLPPLTVLENETNEMANLLTAVSTYHQEMLFKFIIGAEPFKNYNTYVAELKNRGLTRILEIQQSAYQRYLNR